MVVEVSLNLTETELVERTFGNIVPVKVMLSPPSKLRVLDGNKEDNVQVIVS